ncbi:MAG: type III pantothenate kinase [Rhodothermales bacterium]|nr:type III pantothenate kinase [Rhodothermales bacterium]
MMWLMLDIGNSSTKAALHDGSRIVRKARFDTVDPAHGEAFRTWANDASVDRAGAVSVVPGADAAWRRLVESAFDRPLGYYDHSSALPFELVYDTPETLGNDRIAAAAGAARPGRTRTSRPVIAVDTGTAVTYEVVTADGTYLPGPIAPGPELMRRAVHAGTAQLPLVDLEMPESLTGAGTMRAIQAGIMAGFSDAVEGMIARLLSELEPEVDIVLTGGWAEWLAHRMARPVTVEPDLVLLGVRELMNAH